MKVKQGLILFLIPLLLSGCKKGDYKDHEESEGEETTEKKASEITDEELSIVPTLFSNKLRSYSSYKSVTHGKTVTNVLFGVVEQSIDVTAIKSDYSYLLNESHSDMHNIVHTAYYHNNKALYKDTAQKDDQAEFTLSSLEEYLSRYGTYPFEFGIEGYIISKNSVVSVAKEVSERDYKFKIVFDKEKATNNIKIQMKRFGDLDDYPNFLTDTSIIITVKDDFTPVSLSLTASYTAKKIIETSCNQEYEVTYSNFNEVIEVPNIEQIKTKFPA